MFARGNAFYHLGNYEASKGEYLKLINVSENDADDIKTPDPGKGRHDSLFRSLSSSYNNIGAVYQKQNNESKSSVSYWKSIDYAKRISIENEFARVNLARSLNRLNKAEPILDENIPYSVKFYREDMRN
jgi:tetratricopeptide (TPR) repeat protein